MKTTARPAMSQYILLTKAQTFTGKAGYYLHNSRWHSVKSGHSVPKGASVAAHPHAAGQHSPVSHLTDGEWSQLKLPTENVNAGTFNKQIDKMKDMADAGHVTGILGMQYGTNTYGKKLAVVANHILGLYGVDHKVVPGQKAGEHEAVNQAAPDAPSQAKEAAEAKVDQPAKADEGPKEGDTKEGADGTLVLKDGYWVKQGAGSASPVKAPAFEEGKTTTGVVAYYEKVAQKIHDAVASGDAAALEQLKADGLKPSAKGKVSNTWAGKTANSKKLLAMHADAAKHLGGDAAEKPDPVAEKAPAEKPAKAETPAKPTTDYLSKIDDAAGLTSATMFATLHVQQEGGTDKAKAEAAAALAKFTQKLETEQAAKVASIKAEKEAEASKPAEPSAAPANGHEFDHQDSNLGVKGTVKPNDAGKWVAGMVDTDTGTKMPDFGTYDTEAEAFKHFSADQWHLPEGKDKASKPAPATEVKATPSASANLSQIPWDAQLLPDSNKNAKSHNGKVAAIKAMAEAGDIAGLEAFKAGTNTYGKKQMLLAATAAAALKEGAPAEAPSKVQALAQQLDAAKGPMGKLPVADKYVAENGKSPQTYQDIAEAHASLGNDEAADHWKAKAELLANPTALSLISQAGSVSEAQEKATEYLTGKGKTPEAFDEVIAAFKEHGYDGSANVYGMLKDELHGGKEKPAKPAINQSNHWENVASDIEQAIDAGDLAAAQKVFDTTGGLQSPNAKAVHNYAKAAVDYLGGNSGSGADDGPKDGDTKPGANGGTLVFQNGRWHKQGEDEPVSDTAAASEESHPIDAVPMPEMTFSTASNNAKVTAALEALKAKVKAEGPSALKGVTKHMKSKGKYIITFPGQYTNMKVFGYDHAPDHPGTKVYEYVEALKAAAGKPKKGAAKAKPASSSVSADGIEAMDKWTQTGGQGGSNPGGKFKDHNGVEWYCKFPGDDDVAKSEVLAAKLYAAAGVAGQDAKLITKDGKLGIASKWTDVSKASSPTNLSKIDGVAAGFAVDAWLGNWDVVGLAYDNLQVGADGKAVRIDAGGSLTYRAQGGKKAFTEHVTEMDSLRDKAMNPQAAAVFGKLSKADVTASVKKVLGVPDSLIYQLVNQHSGGTDAEKKALAETLIARKKDLAAKFPKAITKKKAPVFKPEKISEPPSFSNWGGTGSAGPSSKAFLNEANENAVQAIYAAAKTGDMAAVQSLEAPIFNKDTGQVTGQAKVLEHPSQHVKGYAQQAVNEINYQLNPPKRFRFEGGHPLHSLNDAYPSFKGSAHADTVAKAGKYIVLGEPGTVSLEALNLPKQTYQSGAVKGTMYNKAAQDAVAKMPLTQKQAVVAYTGSGYGNMNHSLWSGNPTGAAKAAGEALHTLSHEIKAGTVLSRKISVSGSDLDAILKTQGKIIQEPAIMSTSIRPSSWSGNVQLKLHVGPGVKGLWVGKGSNGGNSAISLNSGEDEMILPPNTRMLILSVKKAVHDEDGFGVGVQHVIEAVILPTQGGAA